LWTKQDVNDNVNDNDNKEEEEGNELLLLLLWKAMDDMNDGARTAFVRAVMKEEIQWVHVQEEKGLKTMNEIYMGRHLRTSSDGLGILERSKILEFCGICMAALRLDGMIPHLRYGTDIFENNNNNNDNNDNDDKEEEDKKMFASHVQMRLIGLQNMLFCAVGCHFEFGASELKRIMTVDVDEAADLDLYATLNSFFTAMQIAFTNAMLVGDNKRWKNDPLSKKADDDDDDDDDGVTRIISVQHSEKIIHVKEGGGFDDNNNDNDAPSHNSMDEHQEDRQMKDLQMAKKAADLRQGILSELLAMDPAQRELELAHAQQNHNDFLAQAMQLPLGHERVAFLQNVDQRTQKLLIMHKLWNEYSQLHSKNNNNTIPPPSSTV